MLLILSSAYCDQELAAEFGQLPPAFLPLNNKRLYENQVENRRELGDKVYLSLPGDFTVPLRDQKKLAALDVNVLSVTPDLSLGEVVLECIKNIAPLGERLDILYGDTLILQLDRGISDCAYVSESSENYGWHYVELEGEEKALCGYMSFSDSNLLKVEIEKAGGDYLTAIHSYAASSDQYKFITTDQWLDFGHIHTYFRSKASMTTQRAFNNMNIEKHFVEKTSSDQAKMEAESSWFEYLPAEMRRYAPTYMGRMEKAGQQGYRLEYLYLATLSDLYVFGRLPAFTWERIFSACQDFLEKCQQHTSDLKVDGNSLYLAKTLSRLEEYARNTGTDIHSPWVLNGRPAPSLVEIAERSAEGIAPSAQASLVHGDFCFSNIVYDFRTQAVKVLDPRGVDALGNVSSYGDPRYDLGKLSHSVLGLYDYIIAGSYECSRLGSHTLDFSIWEGKQVLQAQQVFRSMPIMGKAMDSYPVDNIVTQLFLSMLPLHYDRPDRQQAFMANGIKLFLDSDI